MAADPSVSATIFQGIACTQLDEHEWWLIADMQTRCTDDGYSPMYKECLLFSLLVPIGMPVIVFFSMRQQRHQLQTAGSVAREKYSFFVKDYETRWYYWEVVEMIRKVRGDPSCLMWVSVELSVEPKTCR